MTLWLREDADIHTEPELSLAGEFSLQADDSLRRLIARRGGGVCLPVDLVTASLLAEMARLPRFKKRFQVALDGLFAAGRYEVREGFVYPRADLAESSFRNSERQKATVKKQRQRASEKLVNVPDKVHHHTVLEWPNKNSEKLETSGENHHQRTSGKQALGGNVPGDNLECPDLVPSCHPPHETIRNDTKREGGGGSADVRTGAIHRIGSDSTPQPGTTTTTEFGEEESSIEQFDLPLEEMLDAFDAMAESCPGVDAAPNWTPAQRREAAARLAGEEDPLDRWRAICAAVQASEHFSGRDRETREPAYRDWRLSLSWLLKADNWAKVAKGIKAPVNGRAAKLAELLEKLSGMRSCFTDEQYARAVAAAEAQA